MLRIPKNRPVTHPGEMLRDEFLVPLGITQAHLAREIKVPFQRINEIVAGKRGLTPSTALRLAKFFGMSSSFWMNLQMVHDLQTAERKEADILKTIKRNNLPSAGIQALKGRKIRRQRKLRDLSGVKMTKLKKFDAAD